MILVLSTGASTNLLTIIIGDDKLFTKEWPASKQLSEELPGIIEDVLHGLELDYSDLAGIIGFAGPGSYTGLRIGITVINTIANQAGVPIVGVSSKDPSDKSWIEEGLKKLKAGQNDRIILPEYGGEANITKPRK